LTQVESSRLKFIYVNHLVKIFFLKVECEWLKNWSSTDAYRAATEKAEK